MFKQVCVIPFRREFLAAFATLDPTPLEQAESIDMLRALEHGYVVRMTRTAHDHLQRRYTGRSCRGLSPDAG